MQSTERAKKNPILLNEMGIPLIQRSQKDCTKEENVKPISLKNINTKQIIESIVTTDSNSTLKEQIITKWDLFYDDKYFNNRKSIDKFNYIDEAKKKNHMTISKVAEKNI